MLFRSVKGEMPEWPNGTVSKTVVPLLVPGVRIPLSPQTGLKKEECYVPLFRFRPSGGRTCPDKRSGRERKAASGLGFKAPFAGTPPAGRGKNEVNPPLSPQNEPMRKAVLKKGRLCFSLGFERSRGRGSKRVHEEPKVPSNPFLRKRA